MSEQSHDQKESFQIPSLEHRLNLLYIIVLPLQGELFICIAFGYYCYCLPKMVFILTFLAEMPLKKGKGKQRRKIFRKKLLQSNENNFFIKAGFKHK